VIGWLYAAVMAFALVYLGEHYVVDIIAGVALAVVAWLAFGAATRLRNPVPVA
jgi:membrane-associated phospholipid phosphatase